MAVIAFNVAIGRRSVYPLPGTIKRCSWLNNQHQGVYLRAVFNSARLARSMLLLT
jgi:hypothetical protein